MGQERKSLEKEEEEATFQPRRTEVCTLCQTPGVSLIAFLCSPGFPSCGKKTRGGGEENGTARRESSLLSPRLEKKLPPSPINVRVSIERGPGLVMLRFFPLSLKKPSAPSSIIIRIGIRTNLHVDNGIKKRTPSFRNSFLSFLFFFFSICREWNRSGI